MTDPIVLAAWRIRDEGAEEAVLCGLLRWPEVCGARIRETGIGAADFSQHKAAALFDVACYVAAGFDHGPVAVYHEVLARRLRDDLGGREFGGWLAHLWFCRHWEPDIVQWWDAACDTMPTQAAVAVAMAKKVKHLAARRDAVHRAAEQARDALDGVFDTDTYEEL